MQLKSGKSKQGIYNIQHINSYHSELKRFLYAFKGVSTKYLNNYLIWHNFVNYAKETDEGEIEGELGIEYKYNDVFFVSYEDFTLAEQINLLLERLLNM